MKIFTQSIRVQIFLCSAFLFLLGSCNEEKAKPAADNGEQKSALEDNKVQSENCGPASIEELKESCDRIPEWLLSAETEYESLTISTEGPIIWYDGTWKAGTWKNAIWKGGTWENGTWENGNWEDGTWENGTWENGFWGGGTWKAGVWKNGYWKGGNWENGTWGGGIWKGQLTDAINFDPKTAEQLKEDCKARI